MEGILPHIRGNRKRVRDIVDVGTKMRTFSGEGWEDE
jgi:hypothetical protein